jgi:hypothetical protein
MQKMQFWGHFFFHIYNNITYLFFPHMYLWTNSNIQASELGLFVILFLGCQAILNIERNSIAQKTLKNSSSSSNLLQHWAIFVIFDIENSSTTPKSHQKNLS